MPPIRRSRTRLSVRTKRSLPTTLLDYVFADVDAGTIQRICRDPQLSYSELSNCHVANAALQAIQQLADAWHGDSAIYIHPKVLCFESEKKKVDWSATMADVGVSDTFGTFLKCRKENAEGRRPTTWVAMFKTPARGWIGNKEWATQDWHCWAAALTMEGHGNAGKHLWIYDCDATLHGQGAAKAIPREAFCHAQRHFFRLCKERYRLDGVYTGHVRDDGSELTDPFGHGPLKKDMCVGETMNWILKTSVRADAGLSGCEPWNHFSCLEKVVTGYCGRR